MRMQWCVIPVRNSRNFRLFIAGNSFSPKANATGICFFDDSIFQLSMSQVIIETVFPIYSEDHFPSCMCSCK